MSHRLALPLVAVLAVVPISTDAPGRFVEDWPYDRMLRAADLVVLANAVETELTNDRLPASIGSTPFFGLPNVK